MSRFKNGGSFKRSFNKVVVSAVTLLAMTGFVSNASAMYYDSNYCDPCCPNPCGMDCCDMPDFVFYADFLYWQVHPEGTEFARYRGYAADEDTATEHAGKILAPDCELEPGFRLGVLVDLGCCNWDFYAQYTWLHQNFHSHKEADIGSNYLQPLIWNIGNSANLTYARGEWDSTLNVLDFGLGRTFEVNCCFDFRPHLGFKATWQELCFDVTYNTEDSSGVIDGDKIHFKTDFNGIGLRGGFDAAWRFTPCLSVVGGLALSAIYSDLCIHRKDGHSDNSGDTAVAFVNNLELKNERCALIPVLELLFGIRWDQRICDCYDAFVFVGWENQVWWNVNRFPFVGDGISNGNAFNFGNNGNLTFQGLTVRAGIGF